MTDKEATVFVIDLGASMGRKNHDRAETDLDWAMKYVWDKVATMIATGRKTLYAGVVGFRTDDTFNDQAEEEAFENISVLKALNQVLMPDVRKLQTHIKPNQTDRGDAISALVVAMHMIDVFTKRLKYIRRVILLTNGTGALDTDNLDGIIEKLKEDSIELVVLGVDFDDPEYGFKEEDKDPSKQLNEEILRRLTEDCNGVLGTLKQAVEELSIPRLKKPRPTPSYRGTMSLGNPEQYESAMCIDVERYPRTMVARAVTASNYVARSDMGASASNAPSSAHDTAMPDVKDELTTVHNARTYEVKDKESLGGKRDVEREELAKGYEYGRTAVHISESDQNVTKLDTKAGLEIIGFVPKKNYDHYMNMSRSNVIVAQRTNEKAIMAFSSFIHALYELDNVAVAKLVVKEGKDPVLLLLAPSIEPDYECLVDVEVPFTEDLRPYKFPPLDSIVTVSGKVLHEHRNIPTVNLQGAMDEFVDSMDLSTFSRDDEGKPSEYMQIEETFNPVLHRINQVIRFRAINPVAELPPPYEIITKYIQPPTELLEKSERFIENLRKTADIKRVPPKSLSRKQFKGRRQQDQPRSGLDVSALLSTRATTNQNHISASNAIPEFKQIIENAEDLEVVRDAVVQMGAIVEKIIINSVGDSAYDRAAESIGVMREECIEMEEPGVFNDFARGLKKKLLSEELGGDRREMWYKMRVSKLGLIGKTVSEVSNVDEEEAASFLLAK